MGGDRGQTRGQRAFSGVDACCTGTYHGACDHASRQHPSSAAAVSSWLITIISGSVQDNMLDHVSAPFAFAGQVRPDSSKPLLPCSPTADNLRLISAPK